MKRTIRENIRYFLFKKIFNIIENQKDETKAKEDSSVIVESLDHPKLIPDFEKNFLKESNDLIKIKKHIYSHDFLIVDLEFLIKSNSLHLFNIPNIVLRELDNNNITDAFFVFNNKMQLINIVTNKGANLSIFNKISNFQNKKLKFNFNKN